MCFGGYLFEVCFFLRELEEGESGGGGYTEGSGRSRSGENCSLDLMYERRTKYKQQNLQKKHTLNCFLTVRFALS